VTPDCLAETWDSTAKERRLEHVISWLTIWLSKMAELYDGGSEEESRLSKEESSLFEEFWPELCTGSEGTSRNAAASSRKLTSTRTADAFYITEEQKKSGCSPRKNGSSFQTLQYSIEGLVPAAPSRVLRRPSWTQRMKSNTASGTAGSMGELVKTARELAHREAAALIEPKPAGTLSEVKIEEVQEDSVPSDQRVHGGQHGEGEWKYFKETNHGGIWEDPMTTGLSACALVNGWSYFNKGGYRDPNATSKDSTHRRRRWQVMTDVHRGEQQRFESFYSIDSKIGKEATNEGKNAFQCVRIGRAFSTYDPNLTDEHGNTLLHYACFYGSFSAVRQLVQTQRKNMARQENKYGRLPIWVCAYTIVSPISPETTS
jgi:hypothetical protein